MKNFGIHIRLLFAAVMLITATTSTLGYMGLNITHQFVLSRFEDRMLFLARYLALNSELWILIGQNKNLEGLSRNLLSEQDVGRVTIQDDKGKVLAEAGKEAFRANDRDRVYRVEVPVVQSRKRSFPASTELDVKPVIGKVVIEYTSEGINQLLLTMRSRFLWLSIMLACICVMIFYFISRSIVAPVTRLADTARRVADGDLKLRVQPDNLPETRELGLAFNAMLDSIEAGQSALKEANEQIVRQKTLAELGKFSLMVAHEVKNPLSIIKSSMDLLKKDLLPSGDKTPVTYIEDEILRLNRLIEDFLLFARPGVPTFKEVDLNALLKDIVARFNIQMNGEPVRIQVQIPKTHCRSHADADLLTRAVGNILKNAVEANGRQGTIDVRVDQQIDHWVLMIEDSGFGIRPDEFEKIFEPFYTTSAKGSGLGLTFVSQVLTAHGGMIHAENLTHRRGARFVLKIPVRRRDAADHRNAEKG